MTIQALREQAIREAGYTSIWGAPKAYLDLSPEEKSAVIDRMMLYIMGHPTEFSSAQVQQAVKWVDSGIVGAPYADTSLTASVGEFFGEVGAQASAINDSVNPFSAANRKWVLVVLALGAMLYLVAPRLLQSRAASVPAAKK